MKTARGWKWVSIFRRKVDTAAAPMALPPKPQPKRTPSPFKVLRLSDLEGMSDAESRRPLRVEPARARRGRDWLREDLLPRLWKLENASGKADEALRNFEIEHGVGMEGMDLTKPPVVLGEQDHARHVALLAASQLARDRVTMAAQEAHFPTAASARATYARLNSLLSD